MSHECHVNVMVSLAADPAELIQKTREVCDGGINGCIDFVNVPATVERFVASASFVCKLCSYSNNSLALVKL